MKRRDIRNLSTPDSRAFWAHVDEAVRTVRSAPLPLACGDCGARLVTFDQAVKPGCDCPQWRPPFGASPRVRWAEGTELGGKGGGG